MSPRRLDLDDLASALPPGGRTIVSSCSGESLVLAEGVRRAGERLGAMTFTGIFVPGLNKSTWLTNPSCRIETFFMTPELKAAGAAARLLPFCYGDILQWLKATPIDAALFMASPPDGDSAATSPFSSEPLVQYGASYASVLDEPSACSASVQPPSVRR